MIYTEPYFTQEIYYRVNDDILEKGIKRIKIIEILPHNEESVLYDEDAEEIQIPYWFMVIYDLLRDTFKKDTLILYVAKRGEW